MSVVAAAAAEPTHSVPSTLTPQTRRVDALDVEPVATQGRLLASEAGIAGAHGRTWSAAQRQRAKAQFLARLRPGDTFTRYRGSPLRYAGGKSLAVGLIVEQIPATARLVSPFVGGGSVEIALANELGVEVLAFDVLAPLADYWEAQLTHPDALADLLTRWTADAATFKSVRERTQRDWDDERRFDNPLERAAHFFYNHNLSYGPAFLGWTSSVYLHPERYATMVERVRRFRAPLLSVACDTFAEVLPRFPRDTLYCDPPYYLDDADGDMFCGIYPNRNWPIYHDSFDHAGLQDLLHTHEGRWVLSYNDCPTIREWYDGYDIHEPAWHYTMGQGETRIGANRAERGTHTKRSHELLIVK